MLLSLLMSLGLVGFAEKDNDEEIMIENFLEEYFNYKNIIYRDQDLMSLKKLDKYYNYPSDNKYYNYEISRLSLFITSHILGGAETGYISTDVKINNLTKENNFLIAEVYVTEKFDTSTINNEHLFTLVKNGLSYKIVKDEYYDEFKKLYDFDTDFKAEMNKLQEYYKKIEKNNDERNKEPEASLEILPDPYLVTIIIILVVVVSVLLL